MEEENVAALVGGTIGTLFGAIIALSISPTLPIGLNDAEIFQREEGKPAVMRIYKPGSDCLAVQTRNKDGREKYILLRDYLQTIPNEADRGIEEAEIRKAAHWYDKEDK